MRTTDDAEIARGEATPPPPSLRPALLTPGQPLETMCGVPLEPGERVILFSQPNHRQAKLLHILVGVLLIPLLVGIPLIVYGAMYERWQLRFVAITTRRVVTQIGVQSGGARWLALTEILAVKPEGPEDAAGPAPSRAKTEPAFWRSARKILVEGKRGTLVIAHPALVPALGPALTRAVADPAHLETLPTGHYPT